MYNGAQTILWNNQIVYKTHIHHCNSNNLTIVDMNEFRKHCLRIFNGGIYVQSTTKKRLYETNQHFF